MRVVRIKMTENGMDEQFSQFKEKKKAIRGNNQNAGAGKTSFGFAGASMMGFTSTDMKTAYQTAY